MGSGMEGLEKLVTNMAEEEGIEIPPDMEGEDETALTLNRREQLLSLETKSYQAVQRGLDVIPLTTGEAIRQSTLGVTVLKGLGILEGESSIKIAIPMIPERLVGVFEEALKEMGEGEALRAGKLTPAERARERGRRKAEKAKAEKYIDVGVAPG